MLKFYFNNQVLTFGAKFNIFWAREETDHTPWASLFSFAFDPYLGYVEDEERAEELIKAYEIAPTDPFHDI